MKKTIGLSTFALGLLLSSSSAFASDNIKGQTLCCFTGKVLQRAGYTNAEYTGDGITQLFKAIHVEAKDLKLNANQHYSTSFSCNVHNNLATAVLKIVPVGGKVMYVVSWPVTKPNYQDNKQ